MYIFHELKEKGLQTSDWKSNLMANRKYEKLYKKNHAEMIYGNFYRNQEKYKNSCYNHK